MNSSEYHIFIKKPAYAANLAVKYSFYGPAVV